MAAKKSADQWFAEYGESHQDHTNKLIHWVCVPVIFFCLLGFVRVIPVPETWARTAPWFSWAHVAMAIATAFYLRLSPPLCGGLLFFMAACYWLLAVLDRVAPWPAWKICCIAFMVAWAAQFVGHVIERRKPSFLNDVVFLLIGPAWLMSLIYRRIGLRY